MATDKNEREATEQELEQVFGHLKRCETGTTDSHGSCIRCDAAQGQSCRLKRVVGSPETVAVLRRFANIKADDGDDFSDWHEDTIIRCEITVGDIKAAREILSAYEN